MLRRYNVNAGGGSSLLVGVSVSTLEKCTGQEFHLPRTILLKCQFHNLIVFIHPLYSAILDPGHINFIKLSAIKLLGSSEKCDEIMNVHVAHVELLLLDSHHKLHMLVIQLQQISRNLRL